MGDFIITGKIVSTIIQTSFQSLDYQPEENLALLNVSTQFMQQMINARDITDQDKRFLLSVKDKLRFKNGEVCLIKDDSDIMDFSQWFPLKTYWFFKKEAEECSFFVSDLSKNMKIEYLGSPCQTVK